MPNTHNLIGTATKGPAQAYGAWIASTPRTVEAWPAGAWQNAKAAFIDGLACMIAGASDSAAVTVRDVCAAWGSGPCTVVGATAQQSAPWAALINGTAAHALDFDDNFDPAKAHITAILAPALLALAEARGLTTRAVLDAYIVGVQIAAKVGQALNPVHRDRGWHATGTIGPVAAAAACSRLIGLDAERTTHALNAATSFAGGTMAQFGTMIKTVHTGRAAAAGLMAASFAEAGLTAGPDALDGPYGMAQMMIGADLAALRATDAGSADEHGQTLNFSTGPVGEPLAITTYGLKVKRYPTCGSTHRALDAVLDLRTMHGFTAESVTRVDVHAPASHLANLMYDNPQDGRQAKFSLGFCVAVALVKGRVSLEDFTPAAIFDTAVRDVMTRVQGHAVTALESAYPTRVVITLTDSTVLSATVDAPKGRADNPLSEDELWDKFRQCCDGILSRAQRDRLAAALLSMDGPLPVATLMGIIGPS